MSQLIENDWLVFDSDVEQFEEMNWSKVQNIRVLLLLQFRLWSVFIQHSY